ncbi:trypsin [Pochonia chlamydosporia 170]|uniref:Trypsin n=1 Tax=Pochonia chlamydosporia 170 TaxID=1380566 RepID=A0A179FDQ2_METCM|nr:trypsin [Pochonia chlamydosporia 170]OAQ63705.1 trypsin [Pochonia chlamydosporia 170]
MAVVLPVVYGAPAQATRDLHPDILSAMKRDLGLDAEQASSRVAREMGASEVIKKLQSSTGKSFAGGWVSDNGMTINIGVTDKALADEVTAAGAKPKIMANSLLRLRDAKSALDKLNIADTLSSQADTANSGIAAYFVDVIANKLVLETLSGSIASAKKLAAQVGLAESEFEVRIVNEMPTTFATVRGGDAYYINNSARCSIGFATRTGFVTAGHCGGVRSSTTTSNGESLGNVGGSVFPGNGDMAFVTSPSGTTLRAFINGYGRADLPVRGNRVASVGSAICRSGSTTGVRCGTVQSFDSTVNYPQGSVTGLTRTNACAEGGDSGGSWYAGDQAQGVTSGGSGNCKSGGTTYFQPLNEILSTWRLTLATTA